MKVLFSPLSISTRTLITIKTILISTTTLLIFNRDLIPSQLSNVGLPANYTDRIDQVLNRSGYDVKMSGKMDWETGGHSLQNRLGAWTMYTRFPYNINKTGGWADEDDVCQSNGTVNPGYIPLLTHTLTHVYFLFLSLLLMLYVIYQTYM